MSAADDLDPRSSLYVWLAHDLRLYRQRRGLTGERLGKIIGCVRSHVANIEAGRARIDMKQAKILDEVWDTGGHFQTLLFFAETAHDSDWLRTYSQHEAAASVIRIYLGQIVPPPLQTEGYMRALLEESDAKDIGQAVQSRMARQEAILTRPSPPYVWILMDEDSITSEIGGPEVMRAQLRYLLEVGVLPHISIRIIPKTAGAHLGLDGPFRLITVRDRQIGYVGARRGGRLIEAPSEITEIAVDYERIGFKALSEDATRTRICELEAAK
ncbi:helix-turn-helix domain-containing protein [Actinomadura sediminis]|uniref:Helix-turn-helix transcriptional regulator n=1 Tax=Actinomadura sediminis TaxID=1038904 RepID=A0ABW3EZW1_9ACTN